MSATLSCFPPVVAADTRLLILGSLPGAASLAAGLYYAHPRNQFWALVGGLIDEPLTTLSYDARLAALRRYRIGLWDVVASGRRVGSLDADLRETVPNDLTALVAALQNLRAIAFNGATAARLGRNALARSTSPAALMDLPSSSPAFTAPIATKAAAWGRLRPFIQVRRAGA